MAIIYARRIRAGKMVMEDVPEPWRASVAILLEEG